MNSTPEIRSQAISSFLKGLLTSFPIVGPITMEMIEWSSKIKQDRLNSFMRILEKSFTEINIDLDLLRTEESLDLFETIIKKVIKTRGEQKLIGYRNILLNGIIEPSTIDYCEIFSEILYSIKDVQIMILQEHRKYLYNDMGPLEARDYYSHREHLLDKGDAEKAGKTANQLVINYQENCTAESFHLTEGEYLFLIQDLYSKGLLKDDGIGVMDTRAFELMSLTVFGSKFLSFIQTTDS